MISLLLCALFLLEPTSPEARAAAAEHVKQATVAYNLGNYEEAAGHYESAYRQVQDPVLLFNIGQSWRLANRPEKALAAYKGFLRTAPPDHPNRSAVEGRVQELDKAIAEARRPAAASPPPEPPPPALSALPAPPPAAVEAAAPSAAVTTPAPSIPAAPTSPEPPTLRTGAGLHLVPAGRSGAGALGLKAYGRIVDTKPRIWEVGYVETPIYPINPVHEYNAVYGALTTSSGWHLEGAALGVQGDWHLRAASVGQYVDLGLMVQKARFDELCGVRESRIVYAVPEALLKVPVSPRLLVTGLASYRGKITYTKGCLVRPSLLTLQLAADVVVSTRWAVGGGIGHYGIYDVGPNALDRWPDADSGAGQFHLDARYVLGSVTLLGRFRHMFYASGTSELLVGIEFQSRPGGHHPGE